MDLKSFRPIVFSKRRVFRGHDHTIRFRKFKVFMIET